MEPRSFSAEFPNDNSDLHTGTIWMSSEPCGPPEAHFSEWYEDELDGDLGIVVSVDLEEVVDDGKTIPIVLGANVCGDGSPAELLEQPVLAEDAASPLAPEVPRVAIMISVAVPAANEVTAPVETIETLEELSIALESQHDLAEAVVALADDEDGFVEDDPYALFIRTLAEVAVASGATTDATTIDALLGTDAVANAWRAILRGESEDFSRCPETLDEWAANALASLLAAPHKAGQLRRELRARGVAAFGLIDAS